MRHSQCALEVHEPVCPDMQASATKPNFNAPQALTSNLPSNGIVVRKLNRAESVKRFVNCYTL
jgi:hypothetical protein